MRGIAFSCGVLWLSDLNAAVCDSSVTSQPHVLGVKSEAALRPTNPLGAIVHTHSSGSSSFFQQGAQAYLSHSAELHAGSRESIRAKMRTMTLGNAVHILQDHPALPQNFRSFLQEFHVHMRNGGRLRGVARNGSLVVNGSSHGIQGSTTILNTLAQEAAKKLDLEQVKCSEYERRQTELLEDAHQDLGIYRAQASGARSQVLDADAASGRIGHELAKLEDESRAYHSQCTGDAMTLQGQIKIASQDVTLMLQLGAASDCTGTSSVLLQCRRRGRTGDATSFITFNRSVMKRTVSMMSPATRKYVIRESLAHVPANDTAVLLEEGATTLRGWRGARARRLARRARRRRARSVHKGASANPEGVVPLHSGWEPPPEKVRARKKCTALASPTCEIMQEKFLRIEAELSDKVAVSQQELSQLEDGCAAMANNYQAQQTGLEVQQRDAQTALAMATKSLNQQEELTRLKTQHVAELQADGARVRAACDTNMAGFENQICSVKQIRAELYKMAKMDAFIQDCEVSPWTPDACSVSCGSGTQLLSRRALALPSSGGAACPPLEMQRKCNEQPCPVDCGLAEWSPWSSCSARCGGGVRTRARSIDVEPEHGGQPCGAVTDASACSVQSCDTDCQLSDWTEWSACSKMCNGGLASRKRELVQEAVGQGKCAAADSTDRLEYLPCNEDECTPAPGHDTMQCNSKLDVAILLDMSGPHGHITWEAKKLAAQMLVRSFHGGEDGVEVAVIAYSGPSTWEMFKKCTKGAAAGETAPDLKLDCHIDMAVHLSGDMETVALQIGEIKWIKGTTLTSMATMTALSELTGGRRSAQSAIVVITDGVPMSPEKMSQAAAKVKERSRFLWVPVSERALLKRITGWASSPVRENVISVTDFDTLVKPSTISSIVSTLCPKVV